MQQQKHHQPNLLRKMLHQTKNTNKLQYLQITNKGKNLIKRKCSYCGNDNNVREGYNHAPACIKCRIVLVKRKPYWKKQERKDVQEWEGNK